MNEVKSDGKAGRRRCKPHQGWVVVAVAFMSHFITMGINFSCGLFYVEWVPYFGTTSAVASWTGSIMMGFQCLGCPIASYLVGRFGDRVIVISAGLLSGGGLIASAFVDNIYVMMVTFGLITGFGFSLAFLPMATIPMFYFTGRSIGVAIGVVMSGVGLGGVAAPILIEALIEKYGWRGALLLLGGMCLNVIVCGALLRPPKNKKAKENENRMNWAVLKNLNICLFLVHQVVFTLTLSVVYVHITGAVMSLTGVDRYRGSLTLTVVGTFNFLGRVIQGAIGGLEFVNVVSQYLCSYLIVGIVLVIFPIVPYYSASLVLGGLFGFFSAPYGPLNQLIASKFAGLENLKFVYGITVFMCGIGTTIGAPIAGFLYDATGDYGNSMYFGGACAIASVLIMFKPWMDATCLLPKQTKAEITIETNQDEDELLDRGGPCDM